LVVNGRLTLACRTRLAELPAGRVVIEPLPGFEVIKDLVVDMDSFWEKYARVEPWLHAEHAAAEEAGEGTRMSERNRLRIEAAANCILCGLCYASCPAVALQEGFTGPAALAKLNRFLADSREQRGAETLDAENHHDGVWGCRTATRCIQVCPKEVRPFDGIAGVRRRLVMRRLSRLLRGGRHET
jgi:succinate dehydrogenase / fumarate reductase iron-sulfur subunit